MADGSAAVEGSFDLLCFGRTDVDLYAEQIRSPLALVESFAKYVGGSAANICVGSARLGLRTAMLARVGDEALGSFVISTFEREGVDTRLIQRDGLRPTGVVTLALRERDGFPRIFFYRDSPDLAVDADEVDFDLVRRARAVLLTGSMLARPHLEALSRRVAEEVRGAGGRVVFDADFRPVLWGLAPIGAGNMMTANDAEVTATYVRILALCDLVVGTEEEITSLTGSSDVKSSLEEIRRHTPATV